MDTGQRIISVERVMSSAARAVMNNNGRSSTIIAPNDYLPFGEEVGSGLGLRTGAQGYGGGHGFMSILL